MRKNKVDYFEVYWDTVIWRTKDGTIFERFDQPIDFRPYFRKVRERDAVVKEHLDVIEENEEFIRYRLH